MIEHVSTREQENGDKTYGSPDVPALNYWKDVWICNAQKSTKSEDYSSDHYDTEIIDWADDWGLRTTR